MHQSNCKPLRLRSTSLIRQGVHSSAHALTAIIMLHACTHLRYVAMAFKALSMCFQLWAAPDICNSCTILQNVPALAVQKGRSTMSALLFRWNGHSAIWRASAQATHKLNLVRQLLVRGPFVSPLMLTQGAQAASTTSFPCFAIQHVLLMSSHGDADATAIRPL